MNAEESLKNPSFSSMEIGASDGGDIYLSPSWQPMPVKQIVEEKSINGLIAFTSSAKNGNTDIYIMHSDGSGLTNTTNHPANDSSPL